MTETELLQRVKGADAFRKVMIDVLDGLIFGEVGIHIPTIKTLRHVQDIMNRADTMVKVLTYPNAEV